jgi:NAD(P)-dependent dehydrogenase (short-subunit alcohol dehydrogenase family)
MNRAANPEEIASVVGFLAGDCSSYITGETVNANGGMVTL